MDEHGRPTPGPGGSHRASTGNDNGPSTANDDRASSNKRARRYLRRAHYRATIKCTCLVAASCEFILGVAAFVSTRAHNSVHFPVPVVSNAVPLAIAAVLGLIAGIVYGVAMRPKRLAERPASGGRAASGGGRLWPGAAAADLGRGVRGELEVTS